MLSRKGENIGNVLRDLLGGDNGVIELQKILEAKILIAQEEEEIQTLEDGLLRINASVTCREINTYIGQDIFLDEELEPGITIAGFLVQQLNRIPQVGDEFVDRNFAVSVLEMEDRRILWVKLNLLGAKEVKS